MSPWPPEGEPRGKGVKPVTVPRPGHADLPGTLKHGLEDVRDALERASARHTAVHVAAGSVAKQLLAAIGVAVEGRVVSEGLERRVDEAKADRDTIGGVVEVRRTRRAARPRLVRVEGDAARRAARRRADGHPGGEGRRDRRRLRARRAARLAGARRDRPRACAGETNRAGGIEGGVSNGEEVVVRAAMKPLPTLMRPLRTIDLATGEPAEALVERSDTAAVEALAVVAEAAVAFELARAAREKFGGDALSDFVAAHRAYLERIPWRPTERARPAPRPDRVHGRRQDDDRPRGRAPARAAARRPGRARRGGRRGDDRGDLRARGRGAVPRSSRRSSSSRPRRSRSRP